MNRERATTLDLNKRIVIFIGPEGAGKTTIARRLAEGSSQLYISTGDIFRSLAANDPSPLGEECRNTLVHDTYIPPETFLKIVASRLTNPDTKNGFILDGGLRTLEETIGFKDMLQKARRELLLTVIYLHIPRNISFERLVTGANARKRDRDTKDGVTKRLGMFYKGLENRLAEIKKHGWEIKEIDATKPQDEVYKSVVTALS